MLSLYVDTAVREEAEELLDLGIFRGVTTNPVLLRRAGLGEADLPDFFRWAADHGAEEVFVQAWGDGADALTACGERLATIHEKVVVKVPATQAGTGAAARLARRGVPVLMTAVYSAPQSLLAAAGGAKYVAPYLGRMGDAGRPAHSEVVAMQRVLDGVGSATRVLVASVRSPADVVALAQEGVSCFALPPAVARNFFTDPLTIAAAQTFEEAARGSS